MMIIIPCRSAPAMYLPCSFYLWLRMSIVRSSGNCSKPEGGHQLRILASRFTVFYTFNDGHRSAKDVARETSSLPPYLKLAGKFIAIDLAPAVRNLASFSSPHPSTLRRFVIQTVLLFLRDLLILYT